MPMPGPGLLLVLSAPSGAGKTTLARRFQALRPEAQFSVSVTTRPPRGEEREGVDYHFVGRDRFTALVGAGGFAEWAEVHGNHYGTRKSTVDESLAAGRIAIFDIDVQGGSQIQARWPRQAATVLVLPPSMGELERRLRGRSTDDDGAITRRLAVAREEIARGAGRYDYLLVNDDLEKAVASLCAVVDFERARLAGRADRAAAAVAVKLRRGWLDLSPWIPGGRPSPS
jgi:guanylate kinase